MELSAFIALTPQLIVACGVVLAMLLVAWRRSQLLIANFSLAVLMLTVVATLRAMGGEEQAVTILLKVDDYSRYAFLIILLASIVSVHLSKQVLSEDIEVHDEYYLLVLLVVLGAGVLVVSDHFAALFLGFELLSIALVGLVGYFRQSKYSVESGFKYLILSASASSFMLLGIAFIYSQVGDLSFSPSVVSTVVAQHQNLLYQLGFILFFSGVAFKLSLVPFHYWTPDVYQGASTPVTLLLATVSKCAMFIVLLKCCFTLPHLTLLTDTTIYKVITWVAILSMVVGNSLALKQGSVKRLLAYSSIAHMGYLLIIVLLSNLSHAQFAWQSVLFYLSAYVLASICIFLVIIISENKKDHRDTALSDWEGLFWRQPLLAILVVFSVLSFAGIPLTAGFIAKFYLVSYAAQQELWSLLTALIIGSGIALAYYLPIIFNLFSTKTNDDFVGYHYSFVNKSLASILVLSVIALGVLPDILGVYLRGLSYG